MLLGPVGDKFIVLFTHLHSFQMLLGPVGDKFGARKTFGVCLIMSALSMVSFGLSG